MTNNDNEECAYDMFGPAYSVTIEMSDATVAALVDSNYWLYAFKGVESSDFATLPLVWRRTQEYATRTEVSWSTNYAAYTSKSTITVGKQVNIGFASHIEVGQLLTVEHPSGTGVVTITGIAGAIAILNETDVQFTCGVCEEAVSALACAMPLYGNGFQIVVPVPKVLLLFSTLPTPAGTAIATSYGPGILIDQTTVPEVAVTFDINNGWNAGGQPYATIVPANSDLVPLLSRHSRTLPEAATLQSR